MFCTPVSWSACDGPLEKITDLELPSWSWASRTGRINYVQLYDWGINYNVQVVKPCTLSSATLRVHRRNLKEDVTISEMKTSVDYRSFSSELDYHSTNFRFLSADGKEDEDDLGWLTLDDDTGVTPYWPAIGWAVIACNIDDTFDIDECGSKAHEGTGTVVEEEPFYCLLVRHKSDKFWERMDIGSVRSLTWFDDVKEGNLIA